MNHRVVPLEKAKKKLKGFPAYIKALENEYKNPNDYGSLNAIIEELDAEGDKFDDKLCQCLDEMESTRTRFVLLAMLGINPTGTNWG